MNKRTISSEKRHTRSEKISSSVRVDNRDSARFGSEAINRAARDVEVAVVRFTAGDRSIDFNIDITRETVWASEQQIADAFNVDRSTVSKLLANIFEDGELDQATACAKNVRRASDGTNYEIFEYSLDAILSVGYRVSSIKATRFRKWSNEILRSYLVEGYALDERRLRNDPQTTDGLAARLRAIRSEEKHIFAKVRDYFKEASSDYDGSAQSCRMFYALLQDKFHYAASGMTACQLILARADHRNANMGMTAFEGELPTVNDAKVGKNYLSVEELHILHIVSEQFLLHVMSMAMRNKVMTMVELVRKFDDLLRINGYEVLAGYAKDFQRLRADRHAITEYARFMMRQRRVAKV